MVRLFSWKNRRISQKYIIAYLFSACLFILAGVVVYNQLTSINTHVDQIEEESSRTNHVMRLAAIIQHKDIEIADIIINGRDEHIESYDRLTEEFATIVDELDPKIIREKERDLFDFIVQNERLLNVIFGGLVETLQVDNLSVQDSVLRRQSRNIRSSTSEHAEELITLIQKEQEYVCCNDENKYSAKHHRPPFIYLYCTGNWNSCYVLY